MSVSTYLKLNRPVKNIYSSKSENNISRKHVDQSLSIIPTYSLFRPTAILLPGKAPLVINEQFITIIFITFVRETYSKTFEIADCVVRKQRQQPYNGHRNHNGFVCAFWLCYRLPRLGPTSMLAFIRNVRLLRFAVQHELLL